MPVKSILLALVMSLVSQVYGQNMYMRKITDENGPNAHEIFGVFQDSKNFIWFGTDAGIWQYDGKTYKSFTTADGLPDNMIFNFFEDKQNRIWLMMYNNKLAYISNNRVVTLPCSIKLSELFKKQIINSMYVDSSGVVYMAYFRNNNVVKIKPPYNEKDIELIPIPIIAEAYIFKTPDGALISGSGAITELNEKTLGYVFFDEKKSSFHKLDTDHQVSPRTLCKKQKDGTYLIAFSNVLYQCKNNLLTKLNVYQSAVLDCISDVYGNLWVLTTNEGLLFYSNGNWKSENATYLSGKIANNIIQDHEGSFWITTISEGIYYVPHHEVDLLEYDEGLKGALTSCYSNERKELYWYKNNSIYSINAIGNKVSKKTNTKLNLSDFCQIKVVNEKRFIFFGAQSFFYDLVSGEIQPILLNNKPAGLTSFLNLDTGMIAANQELLFSISSKDATVKVIDTFDVRIRGMFNFSKNEILLGADGGLFKYNLKTKEKTKINLLPQIKSVPRLVVSSLFNDLYMVYFYSGEIFFTDRKFSRIVHQINVMRGATIKNATVDDKGVIWLASNKGILKLEKNFKTTLIDKSHGLPSDLINFISLGDGNVYANTKKGIVTFPADKSFMNYKAPDLYLNYISASGRPIDFKKRIVLNYNQNFIRIQYTTVSFISSNIEYYYRVKGLDDKWHTTTNSNIEFSGLAPGDYFLELYAVNQDGLKSGKIIKLKFEIQPPYWKTWWFFGLSILAMSVVVLLAFSVRIKQIKKRESEKNKLLNKIVQTEMQALRSQMNPHFIFNSINAIQHHILAKETLLANKYLAKFAKLIRNILEYSRQDLVTLEQELDTSKLYFEMEALRFEEELDFTIDVQTGVRVNEIAVPPLIIQPLIENAIWHGLLAKGGSKQIKISCAIEKYNLIISVEDNGIGREEAQKAQKSSNKSKSLGLEITKQRIELLHTNRDHSCMNVVDLRDPLTHEALGTRVSLILPLAVIKPKHESNYN